VTLHSVNSFWQKKKILNSCVGKRRYKSSHSEEKNVHETFPLPQESVVLNDGKIEKSETKSKYFIKVFTNLNFNRTYFMK